MLGAFGWAIRCRITSVSLLDWKIASHTSACGRIPGMTDSYLPAQTPKPLFRKHIPNIPHCPVSMQSAPVGGNYPATFLPAVLLGIQAKVGHPNRFRMSSNPKNSAHLSSFGMKMKYL